MNKIIFYGDSITAGFQQLEKNGIINMGIGGDKTLELLGRLSSVTIHKPDKLFVLVGINDFTTNKGKWGDHLKIPFEKTYDLLLEIIKLSMPDTKCYILGILPLNVSSIVSEDEVDAFNHEITNINLFIKATAESKGMHYVDITDVFKDEKGHLKSEYTMDGTHLTDEGYNTFYDHVIPYINE